MTKRERDAHIKAAYYYQIKLHELNQSYLKGEETIETISQQLHDDWRQISEAQAWCAEHATHDEAAAQLCSKFGNIAGHLLEIRSPVLESFFPRLEQIRWLESGLAAAQRIGLKDDECSHLIHLGYIHLKNGNVSRAKGFCHQALQLSQEIQRPDVEAAALSHLGMIHIIQQEYENALEVLHQALNIFRTQKHHLGEVNTLNSLGVTYKDMGNHEQALVYFDRAIAIWREIGNQQAESIALSNKANSLLQLQRRQEAKDCFTQALAIARAIGDLQSEGLALTCSAIDKMTDQDSAVRSQALDEFEQALTVFQQCGDRNHEKTVLRQLAKMYAEMCQTSLEALNPQNHCHVLNRLGVIYTQLEDFEKAADIFTQLISIAQDINNPYNTLVATGNRAHCHLTLKNYTQAIQDHLQALTLAQTLYTQEGDVKFRDAQGNLLLGLGQAYRYSAAPKEAKDCYTRALAIAIETRNNNTKAMVHSNLGLIHTDLEELDEAITHHEESINIFKEIRAYPQLGAGYYNLSLTYEKKKDLKSAIKNAEAALKIFEQIGDPHLSEVKRQLEAWKWYSGSRNKEVPEYQSG